MDEVAKAIGKMEGQIENLKEGQDLLFDKHEIMGNTMIEKIDALHGDLTNIKMANAKSAGAMGVISAIGTLGLVEGIRQWMRS